MSLHLNDRANFKNFIYFLQINRNSLIQYYLYTSHSTVLQVNSIVGEKEDADYLLVKPWIVDCQWSQ